MGDTMAGPVFRSLEEILFKRFYLIGDTMAGPVVLRLKRFNYLTCLHNKKG